MSSTPIPAQFNGRRRRFIDRLTRRVVRICGLAILLVMFLLFVWLLWVVVPLFAAPSLSDEQQIALPPSPPSVAMGMDAGQRWGWRIDKQGQGFFIPLSSQAASAPYPLSRGTVSAVSTPDDHSILLQSESGLVLVQPQFSTVTNEPLWRFPLGDKPLAGSDPDATLITLAQPDEQSWLVAQASAQQITLIKYQINTAAEIFTVNTPGVTQLLLSPDGQRLFTVSGTILRVWKITPQGLELRDTHTLNSVPARIALMSGGSSLLIADNRGISQWFDIAGESGPQLQYIRQFARAEEENVLMTEAHRRVFATLSPAGALRLYASKQQGAILSTQLHGGAGLATFAPRGDGLLLEHKGVWRHYRLTNPWPDISWRNLWQKVWYEHYPTADYVWQSTSANDEYQGKYSLVPMVVGTLKAAGLAMLFATPLALAAAMYTAWFMAPGLRRWVKPAIEMMGALPSVVIGLIAGLWLAPQLADRLLGVLLLPLLLAGVLLLCSWGSQRLSPAWRRRLCREGREIWVLLPLMMLTGVLCLWLIPLLEQQLFENGLAERFSQNYQQRNLLIAGVAMGFALVPLIFTLAEDAIFSVPASLGQGSLALGATPWQTLIRVVVPGASSGIFAALMIGFGRALGETMIVLMATGNTPVTEGGVLQGVRTLAANVAIEMPEAAAGSAHYRILFLSALVLLIFTLIVNTLAELIRQRLRQQYGQQEGQP
ncbi:ABC transporter permease subunit [Erwinia sp. MMLR14_017]|uniref:ABC transporter permease subunit n=1 Tax=Erwinia sp. MMLR14_017 TaxID=3093842 RepID=UPI0029905666|nr:ABC transporter permease subunit [Erwinia sp. MMLR14_017]MDW8847113.1 ABC transporter permease subunit [Erwinia sp. MMLR14_017]